MTSYIIRKILMMIPMLLVISFLVYLGMEVMPGDTVSFMASPDQLANISPERLDALRDALGLNDPFIVRYFHWLLGVLQGDFGYSLTSGVPIKTIVFGTLPATIELSVAALIISTIFGILFGIISALKKGRFADNVLTIFGMIGISIPQFFFGLVMLLIFSINLGWLPIGGRISPGHETFWDRVPNLILPSLTLGLSLIAGVMRYARSSMLDSINKEYIKTARSKGLPEWRVNLIHGFRVAVTPVVVLIGLRLPMLIGGAVVTEGIFQWPGIGMEFLKAVRGQNYPLVMMIAFLTVAVVLIASLLVDVVTALLDPRVRLE